MLNNNMKFLIIGLLITFVSMGGVFAGDFNETSDAVLMDCADTIELNEVNLESENILDSVDEPNLSDDSESDSIAPVITYITPSTVFDDNISVEIQCDDDTATIYYTLDGSNPLNSSTRLVYNGSFILNETTTVHYTAIDSAGNFPVLADSQISYGWVTSFSMFKESVAVELWSGYKAPMYYTLDGSNPENSSTRQLYKDLIFIGDHTLIRVASSYPVFVTCYNYDFSVTYFKKNNVNNSDVIWGKYQGNNSNNGVTNNSGPLTNLTKWTTADITSSSSAIVDKEGHIYIAGDDGYLYCMNSQGLVIWRYGTTSSIVCTPTIGPDGNIYFSNWMDSNLYCISPEGNLVWKYFLGGYNTGSSPVFGYDGTLYVISDHDNSSVLFAFNNHELVWNITLASVEGSTPAIGSDGTLYLINKYHQLVAINWDGTIKFIISNIYYSNPTSYNSGLSVCIGDDGIIYALNQNLDFGNNFIRAYYPNGTLKWSGNRYENRIVFGTPSYYNGLLYIVGINCLMVVNQTGGVTGWTGANGVYYTVPGNILWSSPLAPSSTFTKSSPLISGDGIIYVSHGNMVYAFTLEGKQIWNYTITSKYGDPISFSSPVLSNDGTLIVTTNQGIFAFCDISADFTYDHLNGTERTIQFNDASTPGNNRYYWSFGDGYYSSEKNPSHVYAQEGKYRVELLVTHNGIDLARNMTIVVESWDITPPSIVSLTIDGEISTGGVFNQSQIVELSASDDNGRVTIYYTVDGSNPIESETHRIYNEAFSIDAFTILNAVAVDGSNNWGKVSTFTFNITDSINVNNLINSTLIQKIQELLDNAEEGSKFVFDYDVLYGANFTINKPLNIITTNNTKLVGNGVQPVFTLGENAKGSSINGFTIENDGADGILINNSNNVTVKDTTLHIIDNEAIKRYMYSSHDYRMLSEDTASIKIINSSQITVKDTKADSSINGILVDHSNNTILQRLDIQNNYNNGVWVLNSEKTMIKDSYFANNGKDPYYSAAHQILLDNSQNIEIFNNRIDYGVFGIRMKNVNDGVVIDNNTIFEGAGDAILLEGRFSNVNITHNDIDGSFIGIDFNGYSENVYVAHNLIHNNRARSGSPGSGLEYDAFYEFKHTSDLYGQYSNCIQVFELAKNFNGEVTIIDNVCIKTNHRAWEARKSGTPVDSGCAGVGYNLFDGSSAYQGVSTGTMFYTPGRVDLVLDRIGDATYRLRLINRLDGHYLSELPAFDVKFTIGAYSQTVKFVNDRAVATFDVAAVANSVTATISSYISKTISWDIPISDGYSSSNRDHDPGYEAGEAINNPNPKVPSIDEYIRSHPSGNNGNGQGTGTGNGQGSGNGHGSSGHGGSDVSGREGEVEGDANNLVKTNGGTSASVGVEAAAEGDSDSVEGGSEAGETVDSEKAYEVTKVINEINENNWQLVLAVILFSIIVILGYGYRKGKDDSDEI